MNNANGRPPTQAMPQRPPVTPLGDSGYGLLAVGKGAHVNDQLGFVTFGTYALVIRIGPVIVNAQPFQVLVHEEWTMPLAELVARAKSVDPIELAKLATVQLDTSKLD